MKKGCKVLRCIHCGFRISYDLKGIQTYIHYPVRIGEYKGVRFYGCAYYKLEQRTEATPPHTEGLRTYATAPSREEKSDAQLS